MIVAFSIILGLAFLVFVSYILLVQAVDNEENDEEQMDFIENWRKDHEK